MLLFVDVLVGVLLFQAATVMSTSMCVDTPRRKKPRPGRRPGGGGFSPSLTDGGGGGCGGGGCGGGGCGGGGG